MSPLRATLLARLLYSGASPIAALRVAALGDSVVRGDTSHLPREDQESARFGRGNYPQELETLLDCEAANFGASGATAIDDNRQYIKRKQYQEAIEWRPDVVVLLLGVNDAKVATEGTKQFRTRQFLKGYAQILRAFVDDFPDLRAVYVVEPYPIIKTCCDIRLDLVNEDVLPTVAEAVAEVPDDFPVPVRLVDLAPIWQEKTGCGDAVDDKCWSYYDGDGLHTSAKGAELLATTVAEALEATLGYAPSYAPSSRKPAPQPSYASSRKPSLQPTPRREPTKIPTRPEPIPRPSSRYAPTPRPSTFYAPTPRPTAATTTQIGLAFALESGLVDDAAWHKAREPEKDCAWVAGLVPVRCTVVGEDKRRASDACVACGGGLPPPSPAPTTLPTEATVYVAGDLSFVGLGTNTPDHVFVFAVAGLCGVAVEQVSAYVSIAGGRRLSAEGAERRRLSAEGATAGVASYAVAVVESDAKRVLDALADLAPSDVDAAVAGAAAAAGVASAFQAFETTNVGSPSVAATPPPTPAAPTDPPTAKPTGPPTELPTEAPTEDSWTEAPTDGPTMEVATRGPTSQPSRGFYGGAPFSPDCVDSTTWFKNGDLSKDCDWVADLPDPRCDVRGDGAVARNSCRAACGCPPLPATAQPTPAPTARGGRRKKRSSYAGTSREVFRVGLAIAGGAVLLLLLVLVFLCLVQSDAAPALILIPRKKREARREARLQAAAAEEAPPPPRHFGSWSSEVDEVGRALEEPSADVPREGDSIPPPDDSSYYSPLVSAARGSSLDEALFHVGETNADHV